MAKQTWDPEAYGQNAAFVHGLAGGVTGVACSRSPASGFSIWAAATGN